MGCMIAVIAVIIVSYFYFLFSMLIDSFNEAPGWTLGSIMVIVIFFCCYFAYDKSTMEGIKRVKYIDTKVKYDGIFWFFFADFSQYSHMHCVDYYLVEYIDGRKKILKISEGDWRRDKLKELSREK